MLDGKIVKLSWCGKCEHMFATPENIVVQCPICGGVFKAYCPSLSKEVLLNDKECAKCESRFVCWTQR